MAHKERRWKQRLFVARRGSERAGWQRTWQRENGTIDGMTVHGHYDPNTNRITFNDARQPGDTLFVSFYTAM